VNIGSILIGFEDFYYAKAYINNICALEKKLDDLSFRVDQTHRYGQENREKPPSRKTQQFAICKPSKK